MKVLGISCGRLLGNTEILVKEALMGAEESGAEVQFIRLHDYELKPCTGCQACMDDMLERGGAGKCVIKDDDIEAVDDQVMDCDGIILGSPIYEKSPCGLFKILEDRMGPSHDVGFRIVAEKMRQEHGITHRAGPDPRALKQRTGSLIAVGGSDWDSMALPILSMFALTLQIRVVDKMLVNWMGLPRAVSLRDDLLARARRSGEHVVKSWKKGPEEVEYIGEPGVCPLCHSKLIEVRNDHDVFPCICGVCGVRGALSLQDGRVAFEVSDENKAHSHLLLSGKFEHLQQVYDLSMTPPADFASVSRKVAKYRDYPPLQSHDASRSGVETSGH